MLELKDRKRGYISFMVTDWLMVVITGLYVVATIAIWLANNKSAKTTEKQLVESKRQFEETKRLEHMPYMQASFGNYITSDKSGSVFPNMVLSIGRTNDPRCPSSGKSINLTNIGLGLAVNLKCKWIAEGNHSEYNLATSLLKQEESSTSTFIISAEVPKENSQSAEGKLLICFDDFLGNHYEQPVEISFEIHQNYISLVQYDIKAPLYVEE